MNMFSSETGAAVTFSSGWEWISFKSRSNLFLPSADAFWLTLLLMLGDQRNAQTTFYPRWHTGKMENTKICQKKARKTEKGTHKKSSHLIGTSFADIRARREEAMPLCKCRSSQPNAEHAGINEDLS
jgi:hypothetical protein